MSLRVLAFIIVETIIIGQILLYWFYGQYYTRGIMTYIRANNVKKLGKDREDTFKSIVDEFYELIDAIVRPTGLTDIILELNDVGHAIAKHIIIKIFPESFYCSEFCWFLVFPLFLPCTIKLGLRYKNNGCIRNHKNKANLGHFCSLMKKKEAPLRIYYSTSVRGGSTDFQQVKTHIKYLETFGEVLTKHIASTDIKIVDMGKSDKDIHDYDMELLKTSDITIADVTNPSLGVGYIIGNAIHFGKPVLVLYNHVANKKLSAMIMGANSVTIEKYGDDPKEYVEHIRKFIVINNLQHKLIKRTIFFAGPPGAGKSTMANSLVNTLDFRVIATGQICRELAKSGTELGNQINDWMTNCQLVPAEVMSDIVVAKIKELWNQGFVNLIFDTYPPSKNDLINLVEKMNGSLQKPDIVFYFDCPADLAVSRQIGRAERVTDTAESAQKRIVEFYKNMPNNVIDLKNDWYQESLVIQIDVNDESTTSEIQEKIIHIVSNYYGFVDRFDKSYFLFENGPGPNISTRFHFHIDSSSHKKIRKIVKKINTSIQSSINSVKIYPIEKLLIGPQPEKLDIYGSMVNFHQIESVDDEAFVTGKLGDTFDQEFMRKVVEIVFMDQDQKNMVELEQYLGEWTLEGSTRSIITDNEYDYVNLDEIIRLDPILSKRVNENMYEIHFGFDVPKNIIPDISDRLNLLMNECTNIGFSVGGWFIFKNDKTWNFRSNEFVDINLPLDAVKEKLFAQAFDLQNIVLKLFPEVTLDINFSLEIVHGIWRA